MSNVELRDVLDLIITMLKKHEDRLDTITKQVMVMQKAMDAGFQDRTRESDFAVAGSGSPVRH